MIGSVLRLKDGFGSVYIAITMTANSSQICHFLQRVYCKFSDFWLQKIYSLVMGAEICPQTASRSRAVVQLDW